MNSHLSNILSIRDLQNMINGKTIPSEDFMIRNDLHILPEMDHRTYRAEVAAIVLCTKGSLSVKVNLHDHVMEPGSVLMYGMQSVVRFHDVSPDSSVNILMFSKNFTQETMIDFKSVIPIFKYVTENLGELLILDKDELSIMKKFYDLIHETTGFGRTVIVRELMSAFLKTLGDIYSSRLTEGTHMKTRQEEYFEKFMREVMVHHQKERSVKFYADALHITPKYLSTIIKEISGKSAAAWINDFVIQQAKIMLKYSGKSIQEITYHLNFSTQSFFGKYFKRHTGMSPSEFRNSE